MFREGFLKIFHRVYALSNKITSTVHEFVPKHFSFCNRTHLHEQKTEPVTFSQQLIFYAIIALQKIYPLSNP